MKRDSTLLVVAAMLAGCSLAPPLATPPSGLPASFPVASTATAPVGTSAALPLESSAIPDLVTANQLGWQDFFRDAQLRQLIGIALENNQDLAAATARIAQAEAQFRIQNSFRTPSLNANMALQRSGGPAPNGIGRGTIDNTLTQVSVPAFELDFWGRVANLSESARRQYLATVEAQQAFRLSLVGTVATAYFILRSSEDGIVLAERTLDSRRETLGLAKLRMDAGLTSSVVYDQSHALVNQAETQLTQFVQSRDQALALLRALTGVEPEAIVQPGGIPIGESGQLANFAPGLPSDLLSNRPDIRRAEHRLVAANANIGVARAAYFPTIALTGGNGYASGDLSTLFSSSVNVWTIGANALLPIFDMGRRRAQVGAAKAGLDEREAEYRQTILNAFREVHDGLNALQSNADRIASLQRTVAVQQSLAGTAQSRYDVGLSPYLEVLDAERGLFAAEQALLQAQSADLQSRVNLYLALGGGEDPRELR